MRFQKTFFAYIQEGSSTCIQLLNGIITSGLNTGRLEVSVVK